MPGPNLGRSSTSGAARRSARLKLESLESRNLPAVTASLTAGVLSVVGDANRDVVRVTIDPATNQLVVLAQVTEVARFNSAAVSSIVIIGGGGRDNLSVDPRVVQPATIIGGSDRDVIFGGGGMGTLLGGPGNDKIIVGKGASLIDGDGGRNLILNVKPIDVVIPNPGDTVSFAVVPIGPNNLVPQTLTQDDVRTLLLRASAASASNDGIIAIVDRGGRLLGVFVESGVAPQIRNSPQLLSFAIDGAIAEARTGAFFGNNEAPLTSRTIQNLSETTMTQREIESYPFITDVNSTQRGPGFVAPQGINSHFPADIPYTPQVDLFAIEHTNRDSIISPGPDHVRGTPDDIPLAGRFNIYNADYRPDIVANGQTLQPPESYGFLTGIDPTGQSRGIGTLPGGLPIYKFDAQGRGDLVGGIGVFFPGKTGFATEENSALSDTFNPALPDRSFEAEFIAFAAVGGVRGNPDFDLRGLPLGGINALQNVGIISAGTNRIDLVGITLDIFGPQGNLGPPALKAFGLALPRGVPDGAFAPINTGGALFAASTPVPDGWIVPPRDGVGISAAEVNKIILDGVAQADMTRAAIRLPFNRTTKMVLAVCDLNGTIVGLFRMPDSTIFSIDVAVAKSRNVNYYTNPAKLQPADMLPGVLPGFALTARSFRYLALPRYPEGIDGTPPGPFSILNDPGSNRFNALNQGPQPPASAFQSVQGFDAFNPQSNFHDVTNVANQNGIVFFPGSSAVFRAAKTLIGGFGISGDGVDQDDVVTTAGITGFEPPAASRIDQIFVRGVRVPYNKSNRNPEGGVVT